MQQTQAQDGATAQYRGKRRPGVVRLGRDVVEAPQDSQRHIAAHEVAHLFHRHRRYHVLVVAVSMVALLLATLVMLMMTWSSVSTWELLLSTAAWIALFALWILASWLSARRSRVEEVLADDQATDWGYPVTTGIAAWIEVGEPRTTRSWLFRPFREHPGPQERATRQQLRMTGSPNT